MENLIKELNKKYKKNNTTKCEYVRDSICITEYTNEKGDTYYGVVAQPTVQLLLSFNKYDQAKRKAMLMTRPYK
jgi:hypothetical protein